MLSRDELAVWYERLRLPAEARTIIDRIRYSDPARRVGGGRRNVTGRYPSRKMGLTIQFESHRVELAAIYEMEHSPDALEYYDQPQSIKLLYEGPNGRRLGVLHTPDFFVLRENSAGWEEWKTQEDLHRLADHNANRYRNDDGRWRCPPGEEYASQFGLSYRVRSSDEIDWILQRNLQFLEDYFRGDAAVVPSTIRERVASHVAALPSITLRDLIEMTAGTATPDQIFFLIADDTVYVDLCTAPLVEPENVIVFPSKEASLHAGPDTGAIRQPSPWRPQMFEVGASLNWDGRPWQIANMGQHLVSLVGQAGDVTELPFPAFEALANQGRILRTDADPQCRSGITDRLRHASERDLKVANERVKLVRLCLSGIPMPSDIGVSPRTLRRWVAAYRSAERESGNGYVALLPDYAGRGNRDAKLPERAQQVMSEFIDSHYENLKQRTRHSVWCALESACEQQGLPVPSYKTFCLALHARSGSLQTRKRQGERSAYKEEPFYWELELTTPRHGDRPFEIAHVDHTELDIELRSAHTKRVLGRPWLTLLTDAFSRRVLAFFLTFDPPSYRSCMMIFRECVSRHGRLPQILVMDGGREFESVYFETLLARYECLKKTRPPAKARFGSVCERLFGTVNTSFIYNLAGNTQIMRNVREVTKSVNPKEHAVWTLAGLHQHLTAFLYEIYDSMPHVALGQSPREAFESGLARTGQRAHRLVAYNSEFLMATLPTTPRGTAKVVPNRGVKINHIFYWCEGFRHPDCHGRQVAVRFDPFDIGTVFAFLHKEWQTCHSEHYLTLRGHSERELGLATEELKRVHQGHSREYAISGRRLADFLTSVEAEEVLMKQRLCDSERLGIRSAPRASEPAAAVDDPAGDHDAGAVSSLEPSEAVEVYGEFDRMPAAGFSRELLLQPWADRLAYFQSYTVAHPALIAAKDRLIAAICDSAPNSLILVLGPTGVGKTTLRLKIEKMLVQSLSAELAADPTRLPVVSLEAIAPESGMFNWRDHFRRMLLSMEEPLVSYKINPDRNTVGNSIRPFRPGTTQLTNAEYQHAVEQALRHRRPAAVMIDEAQHLAKVPAGRRLADQLDVIKSIASHTGIVHVLLGTYDLSAFRNLSAQLSRRCFDIHFPRYQVGGEKRTFLGVLRSFEQHLPLPEVPDLLNDWDYLYERSLGCVGVLKEWLNRALAATARRDGRTLTRKILEDCALSISQCDRMLAEILEGERQLTERREQIVSLRARLGLQTPTGEQRPAAPTPVATPADTSRPKRKSRPGRRRPVRDRVGMESDIYAQAQTARV